MKISIKYKLPLIVLASFVLYTITLLLYYRVFMLGDIRRNFETSRDNLSEINEQVSKGIEDCYPDELKIKEFVDSTSKKEKIKISLYDTEGKLIYFKDQRSKTGLSFKSKDFAVVDGKVVYITEIEHSYALRNILGINTGSDIIVFSLVSSSFILLLLIIYLHYAIVRPLSILQKNVAKVNYRNLGIPLTIKRRDEIGMLSQKFDEMVRKLETSYKLQVEMLSSISHDLKTPLTSIMGYIERLSSANIKTEEKKQEYYKIIYKKAQDIELLIEEFSDFAKNELECTIIKKERVKVEEFFTSICEEYSEELQAFNVDFNCNCTNDDTAELEIDISKIRRVFANLISNSLKYSEEPIQILLQCQIEKENVIFSIEDNGKGVPETELEQIFGKFYRIDKSRSPEKGGVGLGLAICQSIIESHNGSISAANMERKGLRISFSLPRPAKGTGSLADS